MARKTSKTTTGRVERMLDTLAGTFRKKQDGRRSASRSRQLESLEPRQMLDSTTVFSELMYNPAGTDETLEWIELNNQMAVDMDLSGWRLDDGVDFTFPAGTVIPGGGYLVIAADPTALEADTGLTGVLGPYVGRLSNGGEQIELINNSDRLMDTIDYRDGGNWPVAPDGSGASLAKIARLSASEPAENWAASALIGGTPGALNFVVVDPLQPTVETLITTGDTASLLIPTSGDLANTWTAAAFVEGAGGETWTAADTGIGFQIDPTAPAPVAGEAEDAVSTLLLSTDVLGVGTFANGFTNGGTVEVIRQIANTAIQAAVPYTSDTGGPTIDFSAQGLLANGGTAGGFGSDQHGRGGNLYIKGDGEANVPQAGFGGHANWLITFDLDDIRADKMGGASEDLQLTGRYGAWGGIGTTDATGGITQAAIYLDGVRIDSLAETTYNVPTAGGVDSPSQAFDLVLPAGSQYLTLAILSGPGGTFWDDGNYRDVGLTVIDPVADQPGLVSYWNFDEETSGTATAVDLKDSNDGNFEGSATRTGGLIGDGAAQFDNTAGSAVNVGAGTDNNFSTTTGITVEALIKFEWDGATGNYDEIFRKEDGGSRILFGFQNDGNGGGANPAVAPGPVLSFGLGAGGYSELDMPLDGLDGRPTLAELTDGQAHYVAATYDSVTGEKAIWVDGTMRFSVNLGAGTPITSGGANPAFIGNTLGGGEPFTGVIDEVAVWNRALDSSEILLHSSNVQAGLSYFAGGAQIPLSGEITTDIGGSMQNINASAYVRIPFDVPANVSVDQLTLRMKYDDGFIAYINGVEVARRNAAGDPAFDGTASDPHPNSDAVQFETIDLTPFANLLTAGSGNVLAVHGLNLAATDNDFLILPELEAVVSPIIAGEAKLAINEVAAAGLAEDFWIEIVNGGNAPVEMSGYVLQGTANPSDRYVLSAQSLAAGEFVVVSAAQLGFNPANNDRLFLFDPTETAVLDAVSVDNELRGRLPQATGEWLRPDVATAGSANSFDLRDEIVINEILYNAAPTFAQTSQSQQTTLVSLSSDWKHDSPVAGLDGLSPAWSDPAFDDGAWATDPATFGFSGTPVDYEAIVSADGPLAYWRLGEASGPTVIDSSGNGNNGTADAGVVFAKQGLIAGGGDSALATSGANRVTVPAFEKFPAGSTGFTVEYWIQLNSPPAGFSNIVGDGEAGGDFYLMNYLTGSGQIRPHFSFANTPVSMDSNATLQVGQVYHVVTTWDQASGTGSIYINGVLDSTTAISGNIPSNSNNVIYLGKDDREPGGDFDLDEVAIYNRPLSAGEVAEHFAAGGGTSFTTELPSEPTTNYFRKEFQFDGDPLQTQLELTTLVDDGAVFYLNGQELYRQNMPAGAVSSTTLASAAVGTASLGDPILVDASLLVSGTNVLAVELHQAASADDDASFAAQLTATASAGTDIPYSESDEEWIELYNRSDATVDLTGWSLDDAVRFDFPAGTTIGAGEYLVVAKDAATLAAKFPDVAGSILGNYSGRLSNSNEQITLVDAAKNPADEVRYYDGGRWSSYADGGGASLELRDPDADNSKGGAWSASDESGRSPWVTYTYRGPATNGLNDPTQYNEFILGLLDSGEVLLDDIRVTQDPAGAAISLIQNGDFESGNADRWRIIGNQQGNVITDPDDPANQVLRLVSTGAAEHKNNNAGTTLKNGSTFVPIQSGAEYEISFRAKWLAGAPQLNTRLYFNRLARTTILTTPDLTGTPGAKNSVVIEASAADANTGPTYSDLTPVATPAAGQQVSISVRADDPDGVASMTLWYSANGGPMTSTPMAAGASGRYSGVIPGQSAGRVVQFYVEGEDAAGAKSTFPADGADSRALYKVSTNATGSDRLQNLEIIMTPADSALLLTNTNLMSNDRIGATVVYEGQVFYDVGVRLKGSQRGRTDTNRRGFNVAFNPEQLFRGVHSTIGIDRSGGWRFGRTFGQDEILVQQFFTSAGGVPAMYNDLTQIVAPGVPAGSAILLMARFDDEFLDTQFVNGSDGALYNYELIYHPTTTTGGPEGLKIPNPDGVRALAIRDQGDDKELYRYHFETKNNRAKDDYDPMIALARAFSATGNDFFEQTAEVLDVDQWLRAYAAATLTGPGDNYVTSSVWHNARFYERPEDGKLLYFPWDLDFAFIGGTSSPLVANGDIARLLALPDNEHEFLGNIEDLTSTFFNTGYMNDWVSLFDEMLPGQNLSSIGPYIGSRSSFARTQLPPQTPFNVASEPAMTVPTTLISEFASASALVPSVANGGDQLGTAWTETSFAESIAWKTGTSGVGYERTPADYAGLVNLDVSEMDTAGGGGNNSVFVRVPFTIGATQTEVDDFDRLLLKMRYDDGFVAYVNGVEVMRVNAPATVDWQSASTASHADTDAVVAQTFDISAMLDQVNLVSGQNMLAIQGLNNLSAGGSSDLLVLPELVAETNIDGGGGGEDIITDQPRVVIAGNGWVNVKEIFITGRPDPLDVTWTTTTAWEAPVDLQPGTQLLEFQAFDFRGNLIGTDSITATSTVAQPQVENLRISELMYNPAGLTQAEIDAGFTNNDDFEFIELVNISDTDTIDLAGAQFTDGIEFTFGVASLAPGERIVVVRDTGAFEQRYGNQITIAGEYGNNLEDIGIRRLSNGGETVTLESSDAVVIHSFVYDDAWYPTTDGDGPSMVIADEAGELSLWGQAVGWRASFDDGGSPGQPDVLPDDLDGDGRISLIDLAMLQIDLDESTASRSDVVSLVRNFGRGAIAPAPSAAAADSLLQAIDTSADGAPTPDDSTTAAADVVFDSLARRTRADSRTLRTDRRVLRRLRTDVNDNSEATEASDRVTSDRALQTHDRQRGTRLLRTHRSQLREYSDISASDIFADDSFDESVG